MKLGDSEYSALVEKLRAHSALVEKLRAQGKPAPDAIIHPDTGEIVGEVVPLNADDISWAHKELDRIQAPPRKRGRPVGSKNRPKEAK